MKKVIAFPATKVIKYSLGGKLCRQVYPNEIPKGQKLFIHLSNGRRLQVKDIPLFFKFILNSKKEKNKLNNEIIKSVDVKKQQRENIQKSIKAINSNTNVETELINLCKLLNVNENNLEVLISSLRNLKIDLELDFDDESGLELLIPKCIEKIKNFQVQQKQAKLEKYIIPFNKNNDHNNQNINELANEEQRLTKELTPELEVKKTNFWDINNENIQNNELPILEIFANSDKNEEPDYQNINSEDFFRSLNLEEGADPQKLQSNIESKFEKDLQDDNLQNNKEESIIINKINKDDLSLIKKNEEQDNSVFQVEILRPNLGLANLSSKEQVLDSTDLNRDKIKVSSVVKSKETPIIKNEKKDNKAKITVINTNNCNVYIQIKKEGFNFKFIDIRRYSDNCSSKTIISMVVDIAAELDLQENEVNTVMDKLIEQKHHCSQLNLLFKKKIEKVRKSFFEELKPKESLKKNMIAVPNKKDEIRAQMREFLINQQPSLLSNKKSRQISFIQN